MLIPLEPFYAIFQGLVIGRNNNDASESLLHSKSVNSW